MAQFSGLQDSKGESSIITPNSFIAVNFSDASISFSYLPKITLGVDEIRYGVNVQLKAQSGVYNLFKSGSFNPSGKLSPFIWYRPNSSIAGLEKWTDYYFSPSINGSEFSLIDTSLVFDQQIIKKSFSNVSIRFGFNKVRPVNFLGKTPVGGVTTPSIMLLGISTDIGSTNNLSAMKSITISNGYFISNNSGITRFVRQDDVTVFNDAKLYKEGLGYAQINADLILMPATIKRVALLAFSRNRFMESVKPNYSAGLGIFVTKDKQPQAALGGVQLVVNDLGNFQKPGSLIVSRTQINLVAGYSF